MHNHFESYLNIKDLLQSYCPNTVLELGANRGENTANLLKASEELGFKLTVVSPEYPYWTELSDTNQLHIRRCRFEHVNLNWIYGVSYIELSIMDDESIDFCVLDTDHNYWTLEKELIELKRVMSEGGIVAIHDTEEFADRNGVQDLGYFSSVDSIGSYSIRENVLYPSDVKVSRIGVDYPIDKILAEKRPYPQAINDIVPEWSVVRETKESSGAVALLKVV